MVYKGFLLRVFFYFSIFYYSHGLVALPPLKGNDIKRTESAIRNTVNGLLQSLKTAPEKAPKLEQYLRIHNYFLTLSLKDYQILNDIERLTRVSDYRNVTTVLVKTINDILNGNTKEQNSVHTPHENSLKEIKNFDANIDRLTAKYHIPHNTTVNSTKIINIGEKLNNILGISDNDTYAQSSEFWVDRSRRIYAGKKAKIRFFPFMAVIQIFGQFYCAGALIGDDLVITAASCLQLAWNNRYFRENVAHVSVRIGSSFPTIGGEVIPVIEIYFNPNYNPKTLKANLAIIRLARHINFKKSRKVRKIDFDRNPTQVPYSTAGISLLGWGAKDEGNKIEFQRYMQFAKVDVVPLFACQEIYSKNFVREENVCIGYASKGGGACNHDIGDPGIVNNILTGIVSFASPVCGKANAPTVLTKLGYYADWIEGVLAMEPSIFFTEKTTIDVTKTTGWAEDSTKYISTLPDSPRSHLPLNVAQTLLSYFNNDTNLYESFIKTCNDKDVLDFAKALKGQGLQLQVSKSRRESKTIYY